MKQDIALAQPLFSRRKLEAENARLREAIEEASDPNFLFGAMDNVNDMDVSLSDFADAASGAIRAYMNYAALGDTDA